MDSESRLTMAERATPATVSLVSQDSRRNDVAIVASNLRKAYGAVEAVKGIDLEVRQGELFGLIGPDGAGKTSVLQILSGIMPPTAGRVAILGQVPRSARASIGYLTQEFSLYPDLSVRENLRYIAGLRRVPDELARRRMDYYLAQFRLDSFTDRLAGRLSGGMKQKLALACALISEPQVLLLDEPTTGVDPVSRREFWDVLVPLAAEGMAILVATSYLDEAERCHRVALMHEGAVHCMGTSHELLRSFEFKRLEIRPSEISACEKLLRRAEGIADVQRFGDRIDVIVDDPVPGEVRLRTQLRSGGLDVGSLRVAEPMLENVFFFTLRRSGGQLRSGLLSEYLPFEAGPIGSVAIGARDLRKDFAGFLAVAGVNIEIKYGEIYGLLGANGAGKTTTIKILCGLMRPTGGEVELVSGKHRQHPRSVRRRVGYMSQKFSLYDDLTINENIDFFAGVYGVSRQTREEKRRWVLSFAGLEGQGDRLTSTLPGGWKQRVAFGTAIMHEPSVVFLDEPTSGVDPLARREFWDIINTLADCGVAVLVTTHYLEEAEHCSRLGIMLDGKLLAEDTPTALKSSQPGRQVELLTSQPQRAAKLLREAMPERRVSVYGERLRLTLNEAVEPAITHLSSLLSDNRVQLISWHEQPYSVEDVFITAVERNAAKRLAG
jgi:ABC-2 type transport system ATP-binding protein